jgi:hypothetical protein
MSEASDGLDETMREAEDFLPQSITIQGQQCPCVFSEITLQDEVTGGGFVANGDAVAVIRKSAFPQRPKTQQRTVIVSHGVTRAFKIDEVAEGISTWTLNLSAPAK